MKLSEIKSTLLQLMKIIIYAEKAAFLTDERKMYGLMHHPKSIEIFGSKRSQANRKVLVDLKTKVFEYLNDRRYSGNKLECDLFIKEHDISWDDQKYTCETIDPYLSDDNKIMSDDEKKRHETNINAHDIQIYFKCSFAIILEHFEKIGLITKEETLINNSISDEESDSSVGNIDSDNDEFSDLSIENVQQNSNVFNTPGFVYLVNMEKLDYYHALFDDQEKKDTFRNTIINLLKDHKQNASREYRLNNNQIAETEESSAQKAVNILSPR